MKIKYSPSVAHDGRTLTYFFTGETIVATYNGVNDLFDFSDMPDGELAINYSTGDLDVETILEVNPIVSAKRVDGVLYIELLKFIPRDATEDERFPDWIEV